MNAKDFEKYAGKHTKGKKGVDYLSGGKIIGYDPKDVHPLQLLAIDDIHGDGGKMFEVTIPDKMDLKDWLCGKHKYIWVAVENVIIDELKEITESNKKTVMETRNVKVSLETAKRWYQQGGEFNEMALSAYSEAELNPVKNEWESKFLGNCIEGYYISSLSTVNHIKSICSDEDKAIFKTEKQAKAALAYAQLTQLMALEEYNGNWIADWTNGNESKYCIVPVGNKLKLEIFFEFKQNICFRNKAIAELFLSNNYDLLMQYSELD